MKYHPIVVAAQGMPAVQQLPIGKEPFEDEAKFRLFWMVQGDARCYAQIATDPTRLSCDRP